MPESLTRNRLLVALLAVATLGLVAAAASGVVPVLFSDDADDRPDDPTTEDTVGYVEGYWYDDTLPVDDRDDAVVDDDELEPIVYRSMARAEVVRNRTFEEDVPVEVISREEFQADDDVFVETDDDGRLARNVTYEALFMVDNETDATAELEAMYGGNVDGYYDPEADRIVIVSDNPETPELDEVVLGHELIHALQDQRYNLSNYERETIDRDNAANGLIEGDARWVDTEYERRCNTEWDCVLPDDPGPEDPPELNWGLYLATYQPYDDGPAYIDSLLGDDEDWAAVDAAYDDPPESSSEVIHREERDPVDVRVEDRSNDSWERLEVDGENATETVGEATMVSMLGAGALESGQPSVIEHGDLFSSDMQGIDYDQPYTDGWAGDRLVVYADANATDAETPSSSDETGYVWETEWTSSEDAEQFVEGYLELLETHDAEAVDDRHDTYVINDRFPGAYALEHDGETVTIVRAPSVDDLDGVANGAGPDGEDTIGPIVAGNESDDGSAGDDGTDGTDDSDSIPGFAAKSAAVAVPTGVLVARLTRATDL